MCNQTSPFNCLTSFYVRIFSLSLSIASISIFLQNNIYLNGFHNSLVNMDTSARAGVPSCERRSAGMSAHMYAKIDRRITKTI